MKIVVILGSSRKKGNTRKAVDQIVGATAWDLVDLNNYNFSYYDYDHKNKTDDFIELIRDLVDRYDLFVFATPVYWYSMSGVMKVFFDRITDLLDFEQELGRKLRGKSMAVISNSIGNHLGDNFWLPFRETAKYLGRRYVGNIHTIDGEDQSTEIATFIEKIQTLHGF